MICPHCKKSIDKNKLNPPIFLRNSTSFEVVEVSKTKGFRVHGKWCKPIPLLIVKKG